MPPLTCYHVVPAMSPQIDDVGDYALSLALYLRQSHDVQSRFLVCNSEWNGPSHVEGFVVRRLRFRNEAGLWAALAETKSEHTSVLLHYAAYGYNKIGVPLWLYRGIKSWLGDQTSAADGTQKQFSTVFHELWAAPAKPWEGNFYVRKWQRAVVKGLHHRSKISITSTRGMQALLENIQPRKTLWLPAPSNIPGIDLSKPERRRRGRLQVAILGDENSRSATVKAHANLLRTLEKRNLLGCAALVGKGNLAGALPTRDLKLLQGCVSKERIEVRGDSSPADSAAVLGRADLFLSHLDGELACKSSAFTAALAARCPAVLRHGRDSAPLLENEHYIASDDSQHSVKRFEQFTADGHLDRIAVAGRKWYERYADWNVIAGKCQEAFL